MMNSLYFSGKVALNLPSLRRLHNEAEIQKIQELVDQELKPLGDDSLELELRSKTPTDFEVYDRDILSGETTLPDGKKIYHHIDRIHGNILLASVLSAFAGIARTLGVFSKDARSVGKAAWESSHFRTEGLEEFFKRAAAEIKNQGAAEPAVPPKIKQENGMSNIHFSGTIAFDMPSIIKIHGEDEAVRIKKIVEQEFKTLESEDVDLKVHSRDHFSLDQYPRDLIEGHSKGPDGKPQWHSQTRPNAHLGFAMIMTGIACLSGVFGIFNKNARNLAKGAWSESVYRTEPLEKFIKRAFADIKSEIEAAKNKTSQTG